MMLDGWSIEARERDRCISQTASPTAPSSAIYPESTVYELKINLIKIKIKLNFSTNSFSPILEVKNDPFLFFKILLTFFNFF